MRVFVTIVSGLGLALLPACTQSPPAADTSEPQAAATTVTVWPTTLNVFGDGFPRPGDPCRRVGESAATIDYLDDSAILVGCPGTATDAAAAAIAKAGGRVVGNEAGITLLSIPQGDANVGMNAAIDAATVKQDQGSNKQ